MGADAHRLEPRQSHGGAFVLSARERACASSTGRRGADCNPYLAYAAALASGLDGIRNRIEPPPVFEGDIYAARHLPHVPRTLDEAADNFAGSDFVEAAFGADARKHYAHFFRLETAAFRSAVTDWERARYFERI